MAGARPCWKYWLPSEAQPNGSGGSVTATGPRLSVGLRAPDQRPSTGVIGRYFLCCLRAGYDDALKRGAASVLVWATLNSAALATARCHCRRRVCSTASLNPATVGASTLSISSPLPASFELLCSVPPAPRHAWRRAVRRASQARHWWFRVAAGELFGRDFSCSQHRPTQRDLRRPGTVERSTSSAVT
jgi:hypothetical protein